jgi:hypothetical protein
MMLMGSSKLRPLIYFWPSHAVFFGPEPYSRQSVCVLGKYDDSAMYYFGTYHYFYLLLLTLLRSRRGSLTSSPGKMRQASGAEISKALVFQSHRLSLFWYFLYKVSFCLKMSHVGHPSGSLMLKDRRDGALTSALLKVK